MASTFWRRLFKFQLKRFVLRCWFTVSCVSLCLNCQSPCQCSRHPVSNTQKHMHAPKTSMEYRQVPIPYSCHKHQRWHLSKMVRWLVSQRSAMGPGAGQVFVSWLRGLGMEGPTTQLKLDELSPDPFVQPAGRQIVTICHNGVRYIMSGHAATIRGVSCLHLAAQRLRVRETPSLRKQLMRWWGSNWLWMENRWRGRTFKQLAYVGPKISKSWWPAVGRFWTGGGGLDSSPGCDAWCCWLADLLGFADWKPTLFVAWLKVRMGWRGGAKIFNTEYRSGEDDKSCWS